MSAKLREALRAIQEILLPHKHTGHLSADGKKILALVDNALDTPDWRPLPEPPTENDDAR